MSVKDSFAFLQGCWNLDRVIHDRRGRLIGRFEGIAGVQPAGGQPGLCGLYREQGVISFGRHQGSAGRTLRMLPMQIGAVRVQFDDGRPFFDLDLSGGHCTARHLCGADVYVIAFSVLGPDLVHERWEVRGPTKQYEALTRWSRSG